MKQLVYGFLDLLMDQVAYVAAVWFVIALGSLVAMIAAIVRSPGSRAMPIAVFGLAMGYALANVALFRVTFSMDSFAIFELGYVFACAVVMPLLGVAALALLHSRYGSPGRLSASGCILWIGCVAFAHLFVIAAVSASV